MWWKGNSSHSPPSIIVSASISCYRRKQKLIWNRTKITHRFIFVFNYTPCVLQCIPRFHAISRLRETFRWTRRFIHSFAQYNFPWNWSYCKTSGDCWPTFVPMFFHWTRSISVVHWINLKFPCYRTIRFDEFCVRIWANTNTVIGSMHTTFRCIFVVEQLCWPDNDHHHYE